MGAVSANELNLDNSTDLQKTNDIEDIICDNEAGDVIPENDTPGNDTPVEIKNATFAKLSKKTNYLTSETFNVRILDDKGKGIANKIVYFKVKDIKTKVLTDKKGIAKLPLKYEKGKCTVKFVFKDPEYNNITGYKKIFLLRKPTSGIKAFTSIAYAGVKQTYKIALRADGMNLSGRTVKISLGKKVYTKKTNSKGETGITIYLPKGVYTIRYSFAGEENINAFNGSNKIKMKYLKNPYNTKTRTVLIDSDGGFTRAFLNDVAKKLRMAGWKVIVKGIGPEQHSLNYYKIKNGVYMPFYNGMCAATIKEMGYDYYGGVIKRNGAVLATAFYTKGWTDPHGMLPYRYDITKKVFLKRAWDDNFSPKSFKGLYYPAKYMTDHGVKYCVGDTAYMIVEQFLYGGWVAHHQKGL